MESKVPRETDLARGVVRLFASEVWLVVVMAQTFLIAALPNRPLGMK
jgi:hypothetical protein